VNRQLVKLLQQTRDFESGAAVKIYIDGYNASVTLEVFRSLFTPERPICLDSNIPPQYVLFFKYDPNNPQEYLDHISGPGGIELEAKFCPYCGECL
jgi:hypothetical protein